MISTDEFKAPLNSIEQSIIEISSLISLPEIYLKIRRLMDDPHSSMEAFCEVISYDPNLSSTVLKVVNSAFFGFPGQIDSISRGVVMLGIGPLHDMVLSTCAMSALAMPNEILPLRTFWRCSLFAGVLTRILANQLKIRTSDRLFVVGLLHEIGHLVIYSKFPEQAKQAIETSISSKQSLHLAEQNLLGLHYGQVGSKLMAQWQLPSHFQAMTYFQPTPALAREHQAETMLLHLAHGYAQKHFGQTGQTLDELIIAEAWAMLDLLPEQIEGSLDAALQLCLEIEQAILN